jgi:hypothetical protein
MLREMSDGSFVWTEYCERYSDMGILLSLIIYVAFFDGKGSVC